MVFISGNSIIAERFDVVIIGAGFAGMSAANAALAGGLRVVVLEAQGRPWINNSRIATGVVHFCFSHPQTDANILADRLCDATESAAYPDLVDAISQNSRSTFSWLNSLGAEFLDVDYGKGALPILQPQRLFQQGLDWEGRGCTRFLDRLVEKFEANGGVIVAESEAVELMRSDSKVRGVIARCKNKDMRFEANSVIIADGGFQANRRLLKRFISPAPDKIKLRATNSGQGRGIELAEDAGAKLVLTECFYGHLQSRDAFHNDELWPYPNMDSLATAGIVVDQQGQRIADEDWGAIWLSNVIARRRDPLDCFAICDSEAWNGVVTRDFVPPNPLLPRFGGTIKHAQDITSLAATVGIHSHGLLQTVNKYNKAIREGRAEQMEIPRGSKRYPPSPIEKAPFYAVPICAGITTTMGGVWVNPRGNALRLDGSCIDGLYVAGSSTGGFEGGDHAGYLGGLFKAFASGLAAGRAVVDVGQDKK